MFISNRYEFKIPEPTDPTELQTWTNQLNSVVNWTSYDSSDPNDQTVSGTARLALKSIVADKLVVYHEHWEFWASNQATLNLLQANDVGWAAQGALYVHTSTTQPFNGWNNSDELVNITTTNVEPFFNNNGELFRPRFFAFLTDAQISAAEHHTHNWTT